MSKKDSFGYFKLFLLVNITDSEKFCRKNVKTAIANLTNHLVTDYSVNEKQVAREGIQSRSRRLSVI
jgi:hypothetical protein